MTIRKLILQLHLWLGLTSGLVVFIVGITGALYVFEEEGRELFQHGYYHVTAPENTSRLPLTQLTDTFRAHFPKEKITSIRWKESKDAALIFYTKNKLVSINPYTAAITGARNVNGDFFTVIKDIHTELLLGNAGKQIIRWNVLIFFIMCISGLVLWWPRQRRFFRQAITINRQLEKSELGPSQGAGFLCAAGAADHLHDGLVLDIRYNEEHRGIHHA
jgi:uncharacterized iron-regulated membrane protein